MSFTLCPLTPDAAKVLRARGGEVYVADSSPGYPCRQCLRDADIGDELLLVSHDPFEAHSPYRSASPIFLHRHDCGEPDFGAGEVPSQLAVRQLSIRAFDHEAMMLDAAVVEGGQFEETVAELFENEAVDHLHVHNAQRGCWAVTITR